MEASGYSKPAEVNQERNVRGRVPQNKVSEVKFPETNADERVIEAVALDCEMVGVGPKGSISSLARVSIVDENGNVLLDKYVKQTRMVTDYRTPYSGIRPSNLQNAEDFTEVQKEVRALISGRILVGHALKNDLKVLRMGHPKKLTRDTAAYRGFNVQPAGRTPSLKALSLQLTGVKIQEGEHDSVEDAWAAMRVYKLHQKVWEEYMKNPKTGRNMKSSGRSRGNRKGKQKNDKKPSSGGKVVENGGARLQGFDQRE